MVHQHSPFHICPRTVSLLERRFSPLLDARSSPQYRSRLTRPGPPLCIFLDADHQDRSSHPLRLETQIKIGCPAVALFSRVPDPARYPRPITRLHIPVRVAYPNCPSPGCCDADHILGGGLACRRAAVVGAYLDYMECRLGRHINHFVDGVSAACITRLFPLTRSILERVRLLHFLEQMRDYQTSRRV